MKKIKQKKREWTLSLIHIFFDKVTAVDLSNLWAQNNNKSWHNIGPRYASLTFTDGVALGTEDYNPELKTEQLKAQNYLKYQSAHPEHVLSGYKYTPVSYTHLPCHTPDHTYRCLKYSPSASRLGALLPVKNV